MQTGMTIGRIYALLGTLALVVAPGLHGYAAEYPAKPIRILVGGATGGGVDITARILANKLSESFKQQCVVENRAGASGNIASELVAKAAPDGYTILMGTIAPLAINPSLYSSLPFDPVRDFAPLSRAADSTNVLVIHPSLPAKSVKELIGIAKARPGELLFGSAQTGSAGHLAGELFNTAAHVKTVHVPYKSGAPAMWTGEGNVHVSRLLAVWTSTVVGLPSFSLTMSRHTR